MRLQHSLAALALVALAGCTATQNLEPTVIASKGDYEAVARCSYEALEKDHPTGLTFFDNPAAHHARVWQEGTVSFITSATVRAFDITFAQAAPDAVRVELRTRDLTGSFESDLRSALKDCQA